MSFETESHHSAEIINQQKQELEAAFEQLDFKTVTKFKPANAEEAKQEFLVNDDLSQPRNLYGNLTSQAIMELSDLTDRADQALDAVAGNLGAIERRIYQTELERKRIHLAMLDSAVKLNTSNLSEAEVADAEAQFMRCNVELYGQPEQATFESLLNDELAKIPEQLPAEAEIIYQQLLQLTASVRGENQVGRFKPQAATVEEFGRIVNLLYQEQLALVPEPADGQEFDITEVYDVFNKVLDNLKSYDLGLETEVVWTDAGAISVASNEIRIPRQRSVGNRMSPAKLKSLLVHELGTHFMRRQVGSDYNLAPLSQGLDGYLDAEEGIAKAMEMAVLGKYQEAGVGHYLTAGLAYFGQADFRQVFETNWRLKLLTAKKLDLSEENIAKVRSNAYNATQRIFRGTDKLPWFKDLSYFNGSQQIWQWIERNIGSETMMDDLILWAKTNPLDPRHQQLMYELRTGKR